MLLKFKILAEGSRSTICLRQVVFVFSIFLSSIFKEIISFLKIHIKILRK